ncbi:MAG: hypothetical protein HS100_04410 [Anaerolineales bacterium]|nr:hypothetical protein [Anaerolineales bacterium]
MKSKNDWSFANLKRFDTLWGPHGYHRYPAKFIPQLVRRIIETYSNANDSVADPFLGSATTGIEALRAGRRFWGSDVSPVALLISQAKCAPIAPTKLEKTWNNLDKQIGKLTFIGRRSLTTNEKRIIKDIDNVHASNEERLSYWFPASHIAVLDSIIHEVLNIPEKQIRTFFLCSFSNILKRTSIWLSGSTKSQKDLEKVLSDPREAFRLQAKDMIRRNSLYWADLKGSGIPPEHLSRKYKLALEDARHLSIESSSIDLLVSSPPYATCYEYSEIHQLTQLWLEKYQVISNKQWRQICIGSKNISTRQSKTIKKANETGSLIADKSLTKLENLGSLYGHSTRRETSALRYYFQDMRLVLEEFARIVKPGKNMVLVVGDSRKRGIDIPTSAALRELANLVGFELQKRIVRKIPGRVLVINRNKTTGRFSSSVESDGKAYPEEDILVFKRNF